MASPTPHHTRAGRVRKPSVIKQQWADEEAAEDAAPRQRKRQAQPAAGGAEQSQMPPTQTSAGGGGQNPDNYRSYNSVPRDSKALQHMDTQIKFYCAQSAGLLEKQSKIRNKVSKQEYDSLVAEVVRFVLARQHEKPDAPLRRDELTRLVSARYKADNKAGLASLVIAEGAAWLAAHLGLELKEAKAGSANVLPGTQGQEAKMYVLRSLLPGAVRVAFLEDEADSRLKAFAMTVLGLIQLNGGKLTDEELWGHLAGLGLQPRTPHAELGSPVEDKLDELQRKRYLIAKRVHGPEGVQTVYEIGQLVVDELGGRTLDTFLNQVFEDRAVGQPPETEADMVVLEDE